MRLFFTFIFLLILTDLSGTSRPNLAGILDTKFGVGGIVSLRFDVVAGTDPNFIVYDGFVPNSLELGSAFPKGFACVDAQRRPLITVNNLGVFILIRLLEDGSLDQTFANNGVFKLSVFNKNFQTPTPMFTSSQSIAIDRQGNILIVGFVANKDKPIPSLYEQDFAENPTSDCLVVKVLSTGQLDTSFGDQGMVRFHASPDQATTDILCRIVVHPDDKITIIGAIGKQADDPTTSFLVRMLPNGLLDKTFGKNGISYQTFDTEYTFPETIYIDSYNRVFVGYRVGVERILIGIQALKLLGTGIVVARYLSDGDRDTSFGSQKIGNIYTSKRTGFIQIKAKSVLFNGYHLGGCGIINDIYGRLLVTFPARRTVAGNGFPVGWLGGVTARFSFDGDLDTKFGLKSQFGFVRSDIEYLSDVHNILLDVRGNIIIAGDWGFIVDESYPDPNNPEVMVEVTYWKSGIVLTRLTPDGFLDKTFGSAKNGKVVTRMPVELPVALGGLAIDASGRIIVVGAAGYKPNSHADITILVARYTGDYEYLFRT